jgi:hypothetical protein
VRLETLHSVRVTKLLSDLFKLGVPWAAAVPLCRSEYCTPFDLDEWLALVQKSGAQVLDGTTTRYCQSSSSQTSVPVVVVAFNLNHVQLPGEDLLEQIVFGLQEKVEDSQTISRSTQSCRRVGRWKNTLIIDHRPPPLAGGNPGVQDQRLMARTYDLRPVSENDRRAEEAAVFGGMKKTRTRPRVAAGTGRRWEHHP